MCYSLVMKNVSAIWSESCNWQVYVQKRSRRVHDFLSIWNIGGKTLSFCKKKSSQLVSFSVIADIEVDEGFRIHSPIRSKSFTQIKKARSASCDRHLFYNKKYAIYMQLTLALRMETHKNITDTDIISVNLSTSWQKSTKRWANKPKLSP